MARYKLQGRARDTWGNTISGLDIYVYVAGTSRTQDAIVYTSSTITTAISAAPQIQSDTYGFFSFWVDDTDYVASTTKFDLYADGLEYTYVDVFNIKHHGTLSGLPRNDHPQYTAASAAEIITGPWNISGTWYFSTPACGATPSAGMHLANKNYVDSAVLSVSAGAGLIEPAPNTFAVNPDDASIIVSNDQVTLKPSISTAHNFTLPVSGVTPSADAHFTTKLYTELYTDTIVTSVSATVNNNYLRRDGTNTLTGDWNAGNYNISVSGSMQLENGVAVNDFSNDTTLSDASSSAVPTEYAVKTYVDNVQALDVINGSQTITNTTSGASVVFDTPQLDSLYSVVGNLVNEIDPDPSIYSHIITQKTASGFTVLLSGIIDSGNYIFDWVLSRMELESSSSSSSSNSSSSSSNSSSSSVTPEDLLEINDGGDLLEINDGGDVLIITVL